ncbi:hypothetical protein D9V29_02980 [Mycetocola manganoxydans]|uniref:DUF4190 domain-containing protein n=1 Tax=Mycetocola manganoxydans TaxID=699879 RepID=A0A3L6ZYU2_9MICO|nr:hypothetical protein [Mycetocola manganoxydans]RLP72984.1 hypothetical protein D9V29_02980 [Mycetocola manganoxydans]GHD44676.1 hypothetical protein GCM10008097_12950 [Mycetocola manganoxydans]
MTSSIAPETALTRRERQRQLNPLRYHAMINPARIPEPVHFEPGPKRLSATALLLGLGSLLVGFTIIAPIAALVFGVIALGREPAHAALSAWGIATGVVFGAIWAVLTPTILVALFG